MDDAKTRGARFRAARELKGWTAPKLAELVRVAPNTIYRVERGELAPSLDLAERWADQCGASLDALLGRRVRAGGES